MATKKPAASNVSFATAPTLKQEQNAYQAAAAAKPAKPISIPKMVNGPSNFTQPGYLAPYLQNTPYAQPSGDGGGYDYAPPQQFVPNFDTTELENSWQSKLANARTQYGADLKQKIIDLGLSDWGQIQDPTALSYLDEPTRQAAANNQYSLRALSQQRYEKQTANARAQLAARGMLSSGQLTKTTNDALQGKQLQDYTDMRDLLTAITGWNQNLADMENQRQQALAQARFGQAAY